MREKNFFVYIITNQGNSVFYIGVTSDLERRIYEHKNELIEGFSKRYKLKKLMHFEQCDNAYGAIAREKQLKNWHRNWKINLVKKTNPHFRDLAESWFK
jgi:putative endonuclease